MRGIWRVGFLALVASSASAAGVERLSAAFDAYLPGEALSQKGVNGTVTLGEETSVTNVVAGARSAMAFEGRVRFDAASASAGNVETIDFSFRAPALDASLPPEEPSLGAFAPSLIDGQPGYYGWGDGRWQALFAAGAAPVEGNWIEARCEVKTVDGAERFVSYLVKDGTGAWSRCATAAGRTWFAAGVSAERRGVGFEGRGTFAALAGTDETVDLGPVYRWIGGAAGDWNDAANWMSNGVHGAGVPGAGSYAFVTGPVSLTNGAERALVHSLAVENGAEVLSGAFETSIELDTSRPQLGKRIAPTVGSFMGASSAYDYVWERAAPSSSSFEVFSRADSFTPGEGDLCQWFRLTARQNGATKLQRTFYFSRLPVLYLTTDDGATPSKNKEEHKGRVTMQGNAEWKSPYEGKMTIKVRGNSTSGYAKKPWKVKLDKKAEVFGMPKSKHWVLLANYLDETNLRDKLAYDFGARLGVLAMKSTWVECVLNGEWQGLYQICEHIRIDKNRVDVFDWEGEAEDRGESEENFSWVDPATDDITGGYLFELDGRDDEKSEFRITSGGLKDMLVKVKSPEFLCTNPTMMNWCRGCLQGYFDAVASADGYAAGRHWSELCDTDSMVGYFLAMEMCGNIDASALSRYCYKDRGEKIVFGPVWDFDADMGNNARDQSGWGTPDRRAPGRWMVQSGSAAFYKEWADDPWFCTRMRTFYWKTARAEFEKMYAGGATGEGLIGDYRAYLKEAGAANEARWPRQMSKDAQGQTIPNYGFDGGIEELKAFLRARLAWMDAQFADVPKLMASLKGATGGSPSGSPYTRDEATLPVTLEGADANGTFVYLGRAPHAVFTVGGTAVTHVGVYVNGLKVGEPVALAADRRLDVRLPLAAFTAEKDEENCLSVVGFDANGQVVARNYFLATIDRRGAFLLRIR